MAGVRWETQGRWDGCRYVVFPEFLAPLAASQSGLPTSQDVLFPSRVPSPPRSILHPSLPSTANEVITFFLMEPYFKMIIEHKDIGLNILMQVIQYLYAG